jgi:type VI secretion system protein ImpA
LGEWEDIAELAAETLRERSKDLEVACWYCEAQLRLGGFAGLSAGLEVLARLVETYWDAGLYPVADEDGVETRLAPVAGMIGRGVAGSLVQPIRLLPISDGANGVRAALWTIELASMPARSETAEVKKKRSDRLEALMLAIEKSSAEHLRALRRDLDAALGHLGRLMAAIDAKTGLGGFATQVSQPLEAIAKLLDDRVGALFIVPPAAPDPVEDDLAEEGAATGGADEPSRAKKGRMNTREDALATLLEVAVFFERTEPQSLTALALREVVRRARLSAAELMQELVPDVAIRSTMLARLGIQSEIPG